MVNALHQWRLHDANKLLKICLQKAPSQYVALRIRFLYGQHLLELGRNFNMNLEKEGRKVLTDLVNKFNDEFPGVYETRQARASLQEGDSIL